MTNRIAIVVISGLNIGEAANAAALISGQISRLTPAFFASEPVYDANQVAHAAPQFSVVLLKAKNPSQLEKLANSEADIQTMAFSKTGQAFNNEFDAYKASLTQLSSHASGLLAVAVFGEDGAVKAATKKFSLLN